MNANLATKPGATAQADFSKGHEPERDDLELSEAAYALLVSIKGPAMPAKLAAAFPGIVNRMAKLWKIPREMDRYFEDLLTDTRGNSEGFPLNILMELTTLKDYYQSKVFPVRQSAPDSWAEGLTDGHG